MNRHLYIIISFFLLTTNAGAQSVVSDALELGRHIVDPVAEELDRNTDTVLSILKKYAPEAANKGMLLKKFDPAGNNSNDPNPFINFSGGAQVDDNNAAVSAAAAPNSNLLKSALSKLGGVDITNLADGLAKFLVERTKQELSIAFFNEFQDRLKDPRYNDLRILFPQTAQLLGNIGNDIYQFSTYLQALREAFFQDLNNLFQTFPQVINQSKYDAFFDQPDLKFLRPSLNSALYLTRQLKNKAHPAQILNDFPVDSFFPFDNFQDVNGIIKTLQLFSSSLSTSDANSSQRWISSDSLWQLVNNKTAFKIYLGLIYQQAATIKFKDGRSLQDILNGVAKQTAGIRKYADFVIELYDKASTIEDYIKAFKDKPKTDITYSDYYNYFKAVTDLFKTIGNADQLTGIPAKVDIVYNRFVFVAGTVNNIYLDINQENYSSAVMNVVSVFDTLLQPVYSRILQNQPNNTSTGSSPVLVDKYYKFRLSLMKYGAFMAQVTAAKTSDDVQQAIESAALPVGSAAIKKHSAFNVALNAYVGPFYGKQQLASDKNFVNAGGMYSPLGISFSKGFGNKNPGSVSLFTSFIDIGALTTFRFSNPNDTLASDVRIKLSQVVAPGIHLIIGLPKWPISIGGGYQWMPLLSKVEKNAAVLNDSKGKRWQLFVAVDLPLLNFYNKPR